METDSGGAAPQSSAGQRPVVDFDILDPTLANSLWERIEDILVHRPVAWVGPARRLLAAEPP